MLFAIAKMTEPYAACARNAKLLVPPGSWGSSGARIADDSQLDLRVIGGV